MRHEEIVRTLRIVDDLNRTLTKLPNLGQALDFSGAAAALDTLASYTRHFWTEPVAQLEGDQERLTALWEEISESDTIMPDAEAALDDVLRDLAPAEELPPESAEWTRADKLALLALIVAILSAVLTAVQIIGPSEMSEEDVQRIVTEAIQQVQQEGLPLGAEPPATPGGE